MIHVGVQFTARNHNLIAKIARQKYLRRHGKYHIDDGDLLRNRFTLKMVNQMD